MTDLAQYSNSFGNADVRILLTIYPTITPQGVIRWCGEVTFNGVILAHTIDANSKAEAFQCVKQAAALLTEALTPLLMSELTTGVL